MSEKEPPKLAVIEGGVDDEVSQRALSAARRGVEWAEDRGIPLLGYSVVLLAADGYMFSGAYFTGNDEIPSPLNRHAFVGMIAEVVRDDLLTRSSVKDVLEGDL
jgi:hypothetical protein